MQVTLIAWTPAPEQVVAAAGKTCYSASPTEEILDTITQDESVAYIRRLMSSSHLSPLEHVSFTFAITGVSRSLLAQITRHRIASFSVQSQRYVNASSPDYQTPEAIRDNPYALRIFDDLMEQISKAYSDIHSYLMSAELKEKYGGWLQEHNEDPTLHRNPKYFYLALQSRMEALINQEEPSIDDELFYAQYRRDRSAAEKHANENARAVLPNAACTNLTMTMNARELLHFFRLRCCNRAQDEIRHLADEMLVLCRQVAPTIFASAGAPCVSGPCPEGKMSCGHPKAREFQ